MNQTVPAKVTFYRVKDNTAKLHLICSKAQEAFLHEKRLLIVVPTFEAAQYIDALLWRYPEEGFIPHSISDTLTSDWIAITTQQNQNVNETTLLFNLCSSISPLYQNLEQIFELFDDTHPQKAELSRQRMQLYQTNGLLVHFG